MRTRCLPHRLGLADKAIPRDVIERQAGDLVFDDIDSDTVAVVREGWSASFVLFHDGRRQIVDLLLPGDFVRCSRLSAEAKSAPIVGLSNVEACTFPGSLLFAAISSHRDHLLQLMQTCHEESVRATQLLAAMGRQAGPARIAAFLTTLRRRLKAIEAYAETEIPYYLRQQDLADILGMTQEHVSRMMRHLHQAGILRVAGKVATILDLPRLERLSKG